MAVKLLMSWDILPGREQDYFEFVVREFIPEIQVLGLETTDAWVTVFGNQPQILTSSKAITSEALNTIITSAEWGQLLLKLNDYVENLELKMVKEKPGFQM